MESSPGAHIPSLHVEKEMKTSYMNYAMSVIRSRALPDLRDGLKPSQRRILYAMRELGLGPRSRYRKCAKICGDTSGNYHPHGEAVVYPTLVRMAQEFSLRYPLVDGQGNFGSIDGDGPAAMRYTEARMTGAAVEMLEDINKDTVDFIPNYDNTTQEPVVFPSKFPNLLCNGSDGIAVGMATSLPPHNLTEICDALTALLDDASIGIDALVKIVPGPDFPTGGTIRGRSGALQAAYTGRGIVYVRAKYEVEESRDGRATIVFTEIPYQVKKEAIKDKIREVYNEGKLPGLHDIKDYSDRNGIRLTALLKKNEDPQVLVNQLFKHTPLQSSFSIINLVIDEEGRPRTLNLKELLEAYRDSRFQVIRRRTRFELRQAEDEIHILRGLHIAVQNIDEVIAIIKASTDEADAKSKLEQRFSLSERQSQAIVDMRLKRLTALAIEKLEEDIQKLELLIADVKDILARDERVYAIIRADVAELRQKYGDARRTLIDEQEGDLIIEDLIADDMMAVTFSEQGYVKRTPLSTYRSQGRGGRGISGAETKEGDVIQDLFVALAKDTLLFFSDKGRCYWRKVYELPELGRTSRGRSIANVLELEEGETIRVILPMREFDERSLVFVTRKGTIKKTKLEAYSRPRSAGIRAIELDDDDQLVDVALCHTGQEILLVTAQGQAARFSEGEVRSMGRVARGVRGIALREGDRVVDLVIASPGALILSVCENGFGKRTPIDEYRKTRRGSKGVINIRTSERNGQVVNALTVADGDDVMFVTLEGMIVRIPADSVPTQGRGTQGVRLVNPRAEDRVVSARKVVREDEDELAAEAAEAVAAAAAQAKGARPAPSAEANEDAEADADAELDEAAESDLDADADDGDGGDDAGDEDGGGDD